MMTVSRQKTGCTSEPRGSCPVSVRISRLHIACPSGRTESDAPQAAANDAAHGDVDDGKECEEPSNLTGA